MGGAGRVETGSELNCIIDRRLFPVHYLTKSDSPERKAATCCRSSVIDERPSARRRRVAAGTRLGRNAVGAEFRLTAIVGPGIQTAPSKKKLKN